MNMFRRSLLITAVAATIGCANAEVIFYENDDFSGRTFRTERQIANFENWGFNDRASSVVVLNNRWEVCQDAKFAGQCIILRPGRYSNLASMGLNDRISSTRMVGSNVRINDNRYAPPAYPVYDNRRRGQERLYEANVTSVRAVIGSGGQRCWIEREQVTQGNGQANVPGAIAGALLGGVLGHQVGGGRGNDVATVLGAVAGGALGADVGRDSQRTQNVQRCEPNSRAARADYWDVSYVFRGQEHRIQMSSPPGQTVTVNARGEPRS
jgi:uncharacterized protein YcfJ